MVPLEKSVHNLECEITSLHHEVSDDSVELASLEAEPVLTGAQLVEVLRGLGDQVTEQTDLDATYRSIADADVEEDFLGDQDFVLAVCEYATD